MALSISNVKGLSPEEQSKLNQLVDVYEYHMTKNNEKKRYYEGDINLSEVNLGIALPRALRGLEVGCEWGRKSVDVLASRSMFDGFVGVNGETNELLNQIMEGNNFISEYTKACKDELKYGCTFATLSADENIGCKIKFHTPMTASALWNGVEGRIDCGMAIIDGVQDEKYKNTWTPSKINFYTDEAIIVIDKNQFGWEATRLPHRMGRPLMEPIVWNATSDKPFGSSRINTPVRRLIQGYCRAQANAQVALEFATSPQKYLMGVTDEQLDDILSDKFKQYVGSIIAGTINPESGEKPTFGQLPQGTINPHMEMIRMLATQFSAATGLSISDTGVVNDANPTSSEAIVAQSQTLILMAEQLNASNGNALKTIALMAQAIAKQTTIDKLEDAERDIIAHFKNPAMPSVSSIADAAIKIASARPAFAETDTFLEMLSFWQADIRRITAEEARARGTMVLREEFNED